MLRRIVRKLLWLDGIPQWLREPGREPGPAALLPLQLMTFGILLCFIGAIILAIGLSLPIDLFGWKPVWGALAWVGFAIYMVGTLLLYAALFAYAFLKISGRLD